VWSVPPAGGSVAPVVGTPRGDSPVAFVPAEPRGADEGQDGGESGAFALALAKVGNRGTHFDERTADRSGQASSLHRGGCRFV
jgi:hypothetical protein